MSAQFVNDVFLKKVEKMFLHIKEEFYLFSIKSVFRLLQENKIQKQILSLNQNDFLCMTTENKLHSCFFIQQNITNSEKYYYQVFFNEFMEQMKLSDLKIFFEIINFENSPEKIAKYFPDVVNTLEPNKTFIFLVVFPQLEEMVLAMSLFLMSLNQCIREYYFQVKSSMNHIVRDKASEYERKYAKVFK